VARQNRKKSRRNPVVRFAVIVSLVILIGFLVFYAIDNPGFVGSIFNGLRGSGLQENGTVPQNQDTVEAVPDDMVEEDTGPEAAGPWQRILAFFRSKFNTAEEVDSYPARIDINVYFARTGEQKLLAAEQRSINAGNPGNALKGAVEELLKGPLQSYHFPVIPAGTRLLESRFVDGVAEIDLSREFLDNALDTRVLDEFIVYSMVNTVTEIPDIGGVIFFIEGRRVKTYGNIDLSIPLIRNPDILPKEE